MRLRHIPGAEEAIAQSPFVIHNPEELKGCWNQAFQESAPLHIEVGMGKGRFIMELAQSHPKLHFIGIERYSSVLLRALQKRQQLDLSNIFFLCVDAKNLDQFFAPGEVSRIYLNFSDPWPKARHARRRLTSANYLNRYAAVLSSVGRIEFKTDNEVLFDFSLESAEEVGWRILASTRDLHQDSRMNEGNVMTEYEEKFSSKGNPIYKLIAIPPRDSL